MAGPGGRRDPPLGVEPAGRAAPTTDTEVDLRTAAQRDADALVELAQRALSEGELPTEGGERPQVVVTVSLPVLQGRIGSAQLALCGRHHRLLHHSHWRIELAGGIPEFHPPPWLGGPPRTNPLHLAPDLMRIRQ